MGRRQLLDLFCLDIYICTFNIPITTPLGNQKNKKQQQQQQRFLTFFIERKYNSKLKNEEKISLSLVCYNFLFFLFLSV